LIVGWYVGWFQNAPSDNIYGSKVSYSRSDINLPQKVISKCFWQKIDADNGEAKLQD
jgi:hypothetical protein